MKPRRPACRELPGYHGLPAYGGRPHRCFIVMAGLDPATHAAPHARRRIDTPDALAAWAATLDRDRVGLVAFEPTAGL